MYVHRETPDRLSLSLTQSCLLMEHQCYLIYDAYCLGALQTSTSMEMSTETYNVIIVINFTCIGAYLTSVFLSLPSPTFPPTYPIFIIPSLPSLPPPPPTVSLQPQVCRISLDMQRRTVWGFISLLAFMLHTLLCVYIPKGAGLCVHSKTTFFTRPELHTKAVKVTKGITQKNSPQIKNFYYMYNQTGKVMHNYFLKATIHFQPVQVYIWR